MAGVTPSPECEGLWRVTIRLYLCRSRDVDICAELPRTTANFAIEDFEVDLRKYGSVEAIVDDIVEELGDKFIRAFRGVPEIAEKAEAYKTGIRPAVFEHVWEDLRDYLTYLSDMVKRCEEVGTPPERERISYGYPRMYSELEYDEELIRCECVPTALAIIAKYTDVSTAVEKTPEEFIRWKMGRIPECERRVIEPIAFTPSPLEEVLTRAGLRRWAYEVYPTSKEARKVAGAKYKRFKEVSDRRQALADLAVMLQESDMYRLGISSKYIPMVDVDRKEGVCSEWVDDFADWLFRWLGKPVAVLETENGYHVVPLIELKSLDDAVNSISAEISRLLRNIQLELGRDIKLEDVLTDSREFINRLNARRPYVREVIRNMQERIRWLEYRLRLIRRHAYYVEGGKVLPYFDEFYETLRRFMAWMGTVYKHVIYTQRCVDPLFVELTIKNHKTTLRISGKPCKPYDIRLIKVFERYEVPPSRVITVSPDIKSLELLYAMALRYGVDRSTLIRASIRWAYEEIQKMSREELERYTAVEGGYMIKTVRMREGMVRWVDDKCRRLGISRSAFVRACVKRFSEVTLSADAVKALGEL